MQLLDILLTKLKIQEKLDILKLKQSSFSISTKLQLYLNAL